MILLITASANGAECATAIQRATRQQTVVASTLERAMKMVRGGDYAALVIDTGLMELDVLAQESFWRYTDNAIPVWVNLAISSHERIVREVQAGLKRRDRERQIAMKVARMAVRNELRDAITGILLSSEMALQEPALPQNAESKLRNLRDLARQVRSRLDSPN